MFNTENSLLSYTEAVTDDPIWNEMITYGAYSKETQEFFRDEGFVEAIANAKRITFMISDKLKYDRIAGKIFNGNNTYIANLVIVACNKPFGSGDQEVFESICKLITREISKSECYQTYGEISQENILKNLIDEKYEDRELYASHVSIIYDSLKTNLYLAVVDISGCDPDFTKLVYFRDLFKQVQAEYKYAIYSNYILVIISTDNKTLNVNEELNELKKLFEQNNISAGMSSKFENLFELQIYYKEAQKALEYLLESKSTQRIFPCDAASINTMEQIRALRNDMDVQYLLNEGFKILGNPVLFNDLDLKLLACTENVKVDDPIWEEYITYGILSDETINFIEDKGFFDATAHTQTVVFLMSDKLRYHRIAGKIYNKDNVVIGCLVVVASNKPFGKDEMTLFSALCEKLSKEVSEKEFYNNYGQVYTETSVNKLINGNMNSYELILQDIANIFDTLKDNLYLAVVDITKSKPEHTKIEYFRDLFKQVQTVNRYAIYSNYILIIISTDKTSLDAEKELNEINRLFEQKNIPVGISSRLGNVYELQKHYTEAVSALKRLDK